ncbi:MAG: hypothetical protein GX940_08490 [Clostridiaceae bacterium]|jgi:dienelactone hydrolase|nr:hypothetical protein [Clostridiaceae bacterium]
MITDELRNQIRDFLGITGNYPLEGYKIVNEKICDGYVRLLITYKGSENDEIPAYLLVPEGDGVFPAVLIHHQHNGERHLGKSEVCGLAGDPLQAFGPALVKKGFVVLAPDSICFEDRRKNASGILPDDNDFLQHYNEMCYRLLMGSSLMKKVLDDANIAIELLKCCEKVDKKRIGVLGHSYGGNTVIFQAAVNEDIAFSCTSGAACTYKNKIENGTGIEMAEVIPGFTNKFDITDLVKCISQRHLLIVSAADDKYSRDADAIEDLVCDTYSGPEAGSNLEHYRYEGGHALTPERFTDIINWIGNVAKTIR